MSGIDTRAILKSHIGNYHQAKNKLTIGLARDYINASLVGSAEALINLCLDKRHQPNLDGDELEKYAQAIAAVNELLEISPDGMEQFIP